MYMYICMYVYVYIYIYIYMYVYLFVDGAGGADPRAPWPSSLRSRSVSRPRRLPPFSAPA